MTDRIWLSSYPEGVPADIDVTQFASVSQLIDESFARHAGNVGYSFMGQEITYQKVDKLSQAFGAYLQGLGLVKGDRVAVMLPNVPQYPIAVAAILRAGLVLVNINPWYTARELEHQLKDSGTKAIVLLENFAATLEKCLASTAIKHVVLCAMGDQLGLFRGALVNYVVRHSKKLVPSFNMPAAVRFNEAVARGTSAPWTKPDIQADDMALLQYTGGTTGVSKGAVLLHRNLVANILQNEAWSAPLMRTISQGEHPNIVCALPLYHIFAFTYCMMQSVRLGGKLILIVNPRDLPTMFEELSKHRIHLMPAENSLFNSMVNHPAFSTVDWSSLVGATGGASAVQASVAKAWLDKTGRPILEGYGLSETSPVVSGNPSDAPETNGTIGVPLPNTWMMLLDDAGHAVAQGQPGEIAIKGPQVMAGYWQHPDETAKAMTASGYFKTGDIGIMDQRGFFRIVDRKKDMVLVSGFNVYPTEIEEVVAALDGVLECACVGVPDARTDEAIKLVIVRKDPALTEASVRAWCKEKLAGYKQPRLIEFRADLPKTPVGKILRRALRDK